MTPQPPRVVVNPMPEFDSPIPTNPEQPDIIPSVVVDETNVLEGKGTAGDSPTAAAADDGGVIQGQVHAVEPPSPMIVQGQVHAVEPPPSEGVAVIQGEIVSTGAEPLDPIEQIRRLKGLLDVGAITPGEFDEKKAELMKRL